MSHMTALGLLAQKIEAQKAEVQALKDAFCQIIKDPTYPLEQRWQLFKNAPGEYRNHSSWYWNSKALGGVSWFDDFYYEKYQTVHSVSLVERVEDALNTRDKDHSLIWLERIFRDDIPENTDAIKEEILSLNLGSWVFDW